MGNFWELFRAHQVQILFGCGLVCVLIAFFVMVIKFHSFRKKRALLNLEFGVALLLFADALAYVYRGDPSNLGYWVVRIANFLVFAIPLANIYFLNEYITALFMETGKFKKLPRRLLTVYILPWVGLTFLIISQFTGLYYSFDETNHYVRGSLFALSYVIPAVAMVVLFSFIIQHHDKVRKGVFTSLVIYGALPLVAATAQIFLYGLSLLNLAAFASAVVLFWFALIDQNVEMSLAANTERDTGLPNTYGYVYEVEKVIDRHAITDYNGYYFDIARMGQFNNKYGKLVGDEIILQYARTLRKAIDEDEILGRLGGNFFVALIKKSNTEKFLQMLADTPVQITFDGKPEIVHVKSVAGGYEIKKRNIAAGQIIGFCADALTFAKHVEKVPYVFLNDELQQKMIEMQRMEETIRKALAEGEFEPFYQPKVNTQIGAVHGAEALARWRHEGQWISPAQFVPILEKNGGVCKLDFAILERTCQDMRGWINQGFTPVCISVNFSRRNLGTPNLAGLISDVVEKYQIPKDLIQVEITETLDDYPMSVLVDFVNALHDHGLKAAIDDFGTGSSSINLMKQVPFDVLKIDKSLADYQTQRDRQLLRDVIKMAQNIGIEVLAEGIEELDQVEELKNDGCYEIQGYVFDKPLPKEEFEKRLRL